jgi:hypothetical protein
LQQPPQRGAAEVGGHLILLSVLAAAAFVVPSPDYEGEGAPAL